jgi:copper(I)-binding protein
MKNKIFALIATIALPVAASAQVNVTAPWVRATVAQQKSTGAFMMLQAERDARLVAVSSAVAGQGQIHQMDMHGDMMKMQQVDGIDLPAGKPVNLASGGYHVMLIDLKRQLRPGENVPLTLVVQYKDGKRETVKLTAPVKPLSFSTGH